MRERTGRPGPVHVLLLGDSADIPVLRDMVRRPPVDAYGQVVVELASRVQAEPWRPPRGVSLTWLCRDRALRERGGMAPRGTLAAAALAAWVAEWVPDDDTAVAPSLLWIGRSLSARLAEPHDPGGLLDRPGRLRPEP